MQQSRHSHAKPKKKGFPVWIPVVILLVLALAAAAIFLLPKLRDRLPSAEPEPTAPEPTEIVEEVPPEPVDMREYDVQLPVSGIDPVDDAIELLRTGILSDFTARYDGSSPAKLSTSYIAGSSPDVFNFILTVAVNGEVTDRRTCCISHDGEMLDPTAVLGEDFAAYLADYIDLRYYTPDWSFNDSGVMVLWKDITEAVSADPSLYTLFLLNADGSAEFLIPPEAMLLEAEQLEQEMPDIPVKIRYEQTDASAEAIPEEEAEVPAADGEEAEASAETQEVEAAVTEPAVAEPAEEIISPVEEIPAAEPDPALAALADELGGFTVLADARILAGDLAEVRRLYPDKPMVALTFDDGPNNTSSLDILDCLESHKAVATFFEVGCNVARYPEVVQREVEIGCEVGSHTYNHYVLGEQSYDYIVYDRQQCAEVFTAAIGFVPKIVRPPEGNVMGYTLGIYSEPLIGWSIDTLDWLYKNTAGNVSTVKKAGNLDGQVILLHSIYPESAASVGPIVEYIQEEGYQLVTISELLEYCYRIEPEGFHYYAYDFFIKGRPEYPEPEPVIEEAPQEDGEVLPEKTEPLPEDAGEDIT